MCPKPKSATALSFAFMSNDISSERQVETAVEQTAAIMRQMRSDGKKIVAVAGPVVVHTGGGEALSRLIRDGWIDVVLAGNALAVHDIEAALLGTSLGVRASDGRRNNMAIAITCAPSTRSIAPAVSKKRWRTAFFAKA